MDIKKFILRQTLIVAIGQIICDSVMIGVFYLLHALDGTVFLGAAIGSSVSIANFVLMAIFASLAADKAEAQDVKGGKALINSSYLGRFAAMILILFAAAKSGYCNVFALVLPLLFVRPSITIGEFFRKSGE